MKTTYINNIFLITDGLEDYINSIKTIAKSYRFYSFSFGSFQKRLIKQAKRRSNNFVYINDLIIINKEFFDIIVVQNNALKFINTFLYVNSIDLLYFILYVCKQLKIDAKKMTFHLAGEESDKAELTNDLHDYIPRLKKIDTLQGIELGDSLKKIDASRHFTLLHLAKCE